MLKTFCVVICACMMLSACGGGGNSGFTTSGGGGGSGSNAWVTGQIPCDSGCTSTESGMQIQIQPNSTIGTGSTSGCSFLVELSNTSSDLGLPTLAGGIAYVSLIAPNCGGAGGTTWTATITFTSVNGGTTNWSSATASMLNSQNQWVSVTPTSTASSLTINATVVSKAVTNFAVAN